MYVNQFNKFGRVYQVYVQAEQDARADEADVGRLQVRNKDGQMIYLNAFVDIEPTVGPYSIQHYDMYRSAAINGGPAPGYSSGQAVEAMEELAAAVLPEGFGYQWTDVVYQQKQAGNLAPLIFALSLVVVFLVLAALYESWVDAGDHPDGDSARPARRGRRPDAARPRSRRLRPDRSGDADRAGRQELDPDRRVRAGRAARGARASWRRR